VYACLCVRVYHEVQSRQLVVVPPPVVCICVYVCMRVCVCVCIRREVTSRWMCV